MKHFLSPKVLKEKRPKIYKAFVKACGANTREANKVLTWGNNPEVSVDPRWLIPWQGKANCGVTRGQRINPNTVEISSSRVIPLEKCIYEGDVTKNTMRFESTLLHEMIHYAREVAGLTEKDWDFPDSEEVGAQFEMWAYGKLTCTEDDDKDAAASYM